MNDGAPNTLHLTKDDNPEVADYLASKSAGETCELRVTGQVRELGDAGATIDIISAEALDYEEPMPADEAADAEAIESALGGPTEML